MTSSHFMAQGILAPLILIVVAGEGRTRGRLEKVKKSQIAVVFPRESALGLEMVGGHLEATYGRGQEVLLTANFEEALEMYGITLFVYALIGHLRETTPHIQFDLPVAHPQSPTAPPSST